MTGKQLEMTKECPIFQWNPGIPIMDQADSKPENMRASFHINEENEDMIYYGE